MALVFQYGSNLNLVRLNGPDRLCGAAVFVTKAVTVENYEFTFDLWSKGGKCAAADLVEHGGRKIWGVVYQVPDHLICRETARPKKSLDAIEGEGTNYRRTVIRVMNMHDQLLSEDVWTYVGIGNVRNTKISTSQDYVDHILKGAKAHALPTDYIDYLIERALASNPALKIVRDTGRLDYSL